MERYLGLVRHCSQHEEVKKQCLLEMASRATANYIKQNLRDQAEEEGMFRQESLFPTICIFYNRMIEVAGEIWKNPKLIKALLIEKFGKECLTEREKRADYNLRTNHGWRSSESTRDENWNFCGRECPSEILQSREETKIDFFCE